MTDSECTLDESVAALRNIFFKWIECDPDFNNDFENVIFCQKCMSHTEKGRLVWYAKGQTNWRVYILTINHATEWQLNKFMTIC